MGPLGVVVDHPPIHRDLRRREGLERIGVGEEVRAESAVKPLHLPVLVRRCRLCEPMRDAVLAADLVEQHLPAAGAIAAEPIRELLAVVRDHLLGCPIASQRLREGQTHRPRRRPLHHRGHHTEPGVIIDPSDDLGAPHLTSGHVDQLDAAHDVDAPQLHRPGPFESLPRLPGPFPRTLAQQAAPDQDPVDRALRRHRDRLIAPRGPAQQLQPDPPRPPPRMGPTHLRHRHLDHLRRLLRTRQRTMRPVRQPADPLSQIPRHPPMHRRAMHPRSRRHLDDIHAAQHSPDRVQALLDHRQDNQCQSRPPRVRNAPRRRPNPDCRSRPLSQIN